MVEIRQIGFLVLTTHTTNCAWPAHGKFAVTFDQLGQYASSAGSKAYCYTVLDVCLDYHESMPIHSGMPGLSGPGWDCECLV